MIFFPNKNFKLTTKTAFSLIELSVVILIIGVLVLGVTQGSRMMSEAKLKSARSLTTSSPVASIEGLAVWLDSTSENAFGIGTGGTYNNVSAPGNGDKVGRWNDLNPTSTSKLDVAQSTSGNQPIYTTNAINGLPALSFDGTDRSLSANNITDKSFTLFAVFKTAVAGGTPHGYHGQPILYSDSSTNSNDIIPLAVAGGYPVITNGLSSGSDSTLTGTKKVNDNKAHLVTVYRNMDNGARKFYIDGVVDAPDNNGYQGAVLNAKTYILIGKNDVDGRYFNGNIAEIIIFSRVLQNQEIDSVNDYLKSKWSVKN